MKQVFAYLLVSAIFLHLFADLIVFVSFKINQDYIAEFLCINKDEPESNCNGCCHLKKELDEQQESKESLPPQETKNYEIQFFTNDLRNDNLVINYKELIVLFYLKNTGIINPRSIFHPPKSLHA